MSSPSSTGWSLPSLSPPSSWYAHSLMPLSGSICRGPCGRPHSCVSCLACGCVVQALLFLCFVYLYCPPADQAHYIKVDTRQLKEAYHRMGPMSFPQKVILVDFVGLALLWYLNSPCACITFHSKNIPDLVAHHLLCAQVQSQGDFRPGNSRLAAALLPPVQLHIRRNGVHG